MNDLTFLMIRSFFLRQGTLQKVYKLTTFSSYKSNKTRNKSLEKEFSIKSNFPHIRSLKKTIITITTSIYSFVISTLRQCAFSSCHGYIYIQIASFLFFFSFLPFFLFGHRKRRNSEALMSRSLMSCLPRFRHCCFQDANTSFSSRGKTLGKEKRARPLNRKEP